MPRFSRALLVAPVLLLARTATAAPVVITGEPIAPAPTVSGIGLCAASNVSSAPETDFPQAAGSFTSGMNTFFEANRATRVTKGQTTVLDLSNNLGDAGGPSFGDFTNADATCPAGGCALFVNDAITSFATRFRGFYRVPTALAGTPIHFGVYADDAVSLTFFDASKLPYPVIVRPPQLGSPTWRVTNTVTFPKAGLYGVEILYAQVAEHAALEVSTFEGTFEDLERPASESPVVSLKTAGFTLIGPGDFYQTEGGGASVPDLEACAQCARENAGVPGKTDCVSGFHCNRAALCERCDSADYCGDDCAPCFGTKPVCGEVGGTLQCVQCNTNADCDTGDVCVEHHCGPCLDCDAGVDAGFDGSVDGGSADDGGALPANDQGDGGCGCRAAGSPARASWPAALALGGLAIARLRRRARV